MKLDFEKNGVSLRRNIGDDARMREAYGQLLRNVLGPDITPATAQSPWTSTAFFSSDGRCLAGLETGCLPLILDNEIFPAAGIRSAATDPDWRGRGLFRQLMAVALEWCEAHSTSVTMLYTETPSLYERFGFRQVLQHAFTGPATARSSGSRGRRLALSDADDRKLAYEIITRRAPISSRCALLVDAPLFIANVTKDDDLTLLHDPANDTLIVFQEDGDQIIIADVAASRIPTLADVIRIVAPSATHVKCLFPPDKIGWDGQPERIDTGLMVRGPIPPAMRAPFMFPPTAEF